MDGEASRLHAAMVAAVAKHGYATTTVGELAELADVSPDAFHELFASREECFLAAQDAIVGYAMARALSAYEREGPANATTARAVLAELVECVVVDPDAAYLAIVAPQGVGARAIVASERALAVLEGMLNEGFARTAGRTRTSEVLAKAIVAGCARVAQEHLEAGQSVRVPGRLDAMSGWVRSYCVAAAGWSGPRSPHAGAVDEAVRVARLSGDGVSPRGRILRAVARLWANGGSEAVTVSEIAASAGVSLEVFHEYFRDEREASLLCYERASRLAFGVTLASFQAATSWPRAIHSSLHTLTALLAAGPEFARVSLVEARAAEPAVRERAEMRLDAFGALLDPGFRYGATPPQRVIASAITGGIFGVLRHHVLHDQTVWLPSIADDLTFFALLPFLGPERAAEVIAEPVQERLDG
jgi:AcrR family transcriptional regulator